MHAFVNGRPEFIIEKIDVYFFFLGLTPLNMDTTNPSHVHTKHHATPDTQSAALEFTRQKKKCAPASIDAANKVNEVPRTLAQIAKLTAQAMPVKMLRSFAHSMTTRDMRDVDNLDVKTKHVNEIAQ